MVLSYSLWRFVTDLAYHANNMVDRSENVIGDSYMKCAWHAVSRSKIIWCYCPEFALGNVMLTKGIS